MEFRHRLPDATRITGGAYNETQCFALLSTGLPGGDETKVCLQFTPGQGAELVAQIQRAVDEALADAERAAQRALARQQAAA